MGSSEDWDEGHRERREQLTAKEIKTGDGQVSSFL